MPKAAKFISATVVIDQSKVVGLALLDDGNSSISFGNFNSTGTQNKTILFAADQQPIGLYGTGSSSGIYSLGFLTFSAKCESDRKSKEQLDKFLSGNSPSPQTAKTSKKTGVIYIVLVIIGTAVVLVAIVVVLVVLIKQI